MTQENEQLKENFNFRQLLAPKSPFTILSEMIGTEAQFEYTDNPPLPPHSERDLADSGERHTLISSIENDNSMGTGSTYEQARDECSESAIMSVILRRYRQIRPEKNKEELLLADETPFELASMAIHKMLVEWNEIDGFELPQQLSDAINPMSSCVVKTSVADKLDWIKGGVLSEHLVEKETSKLAKKVRNNICRRCNDRVFITDQKVDGGFMWHNSCFTAQAKEDMARDPLGYLNNIHSGVQFIDLTCWGSGPEKTFTIGATLDGETYCGSGQNKKTAKQNCARSILSHRYPNGNY